LFSEGNSNNSGDTKGDDGRLRISDFFERWGWEYSLGLVVKDTNLTEDQIFEWSVIRYYNKLAYLKDKGKFEIALNGNR
jgi:hypothetical protein